MKCFKKACRKFSLAGLVMRFEFSTDESVRQKIIVTQAPIAAAARPPEEFLNAYLLLLGQNVLNSTNCTYGASFVVIVVFLILRSVKTPLDYDLIAVSFRR